MTCDNKMIYDSRPWLKSYDPKVRSDIDVPGVTLKDWAERLDKDFPERAALHFIGITWTYRQLLERADRFARALRTNGIGRGDVVAINLVNSPQFLVVLYGTIKACVIWCCLSPLMSPDEMVYQLTDSGAKAVVTMDNLFHEKLAGIVDAVPDLELIVVTKLLDFVEEEKSSSILAQLVGRRVMWLKDLLSQALTEEPDLRPAPEDTACIQYTGGTTGIPRGAMLTRRNIVANVIQYGEWNKYEMKTEVTLNCFPFFHVGGLSHALRSLGYAYTQIVIHNPRDTQHIVKEVGRYRPTYMGCVPTLYLLLLKEPEFRALDLSCVRTCVSGAAPFPTERFKDFEDIFGTGKLIDGYGLTEGAPLLTFNPKEGGQKKGSVGLPLPSTWLRVVDTETGEKEMPLGEDGEIIVKGPQVMKGYFNLPEETGAALRVHDGEVWLHTGDVARMDGDGYVYIVARTKDMISVGGGYKVFSTEVEHKLAKSPAIELCAIIGVPNPERPGVEMVKLVVQKSLSYRDKPDKEVGEELTAFSREKLAPYKVPKIIEFVASMPLKSVGKVDKKSLRRTEQGEGEN